MKSIEDTLVEVEERIAYLQDQVDTANAEIAKGIPVPGIRATRATLEELRSLHLWIIDA